MRMYVKHFYFSDRKWYISGMESDLLHTRWQIDLPIDQEDAVTEWLMEKGASAFFREADPPMIFFAYFPPGTPLPDMGELGAFNGVSAIRAETFADEDWLEKSREGFGAMDVGRRFFVRPVWSNEEPGAGRIPIIVNPGIAFGTGGHETTRLCMELMEGLALEEPDKKLHGPVLDIGSGTGILAFAAHILGAEDITALDIDPDCGPAMAELIQINSGAARHAEPFFPVISTLEDPRLDRKFNLVLANILLETIAELLPLIIQRLAPGGCLVASGILAERQDEALLAMASSGLSLKKVAIEGEWMAVLASHQ